MVEQVRVRVTPRASSNRIVKEKNDQDELIYKVYVTTVPEDGKANKEVIKLLAKELGVAKSSLEIERGHTSREKVINILR